MTYIFITITIAVTKIDKQYMKHNKSKKQTCNKIKKQNKTRWNVSVVSSNYT